MAQAVLHRCMQKGAPQKTTTPKGKAERLVSAAGQGSTATRPASFASEHAEVHVPAVHSSCASAQSHLRGTGGAAR